jgi:hypothetical protein
MWSQGRQSAWSLGVGAGLLLLTACNFTPGEGEFTAESFRYGDCEARVLPWEPGFYTIDTFEDTVTIRLQTVGGNLEQVDGIYVQVNRAYVAGHLNQDIPLGMTDTDGDGEEELLARATMGFFFSCPEHGRVVPELEGTIRFARFEPYNDGQISATLDAPRVVDARNGEVLGTNLTGSFRFLVQNGRPYSNFTGPR